MSPRPRVLADLFARTRVHDGALVLGAVLFTALLAQVSISVPGSPMPITEQTLAALLVGLAARHGLDRQPWKAVPVFIARQFVRALLLRFLHRRCQRQALLLRPRRKPPSGGAQVQTSSHVTSSETA